MDGWMEERASQSSAGDSETRELMVSFTAVSRFPAFSFSRFRSF